MAAIAPQADQAAGLLQNLSLDSQSKTKTNLDLPEPNKKTPTAQMGTIDSKNAPNGHILPNNMDSSLCYVPNSYQQAGYYYANYDGTGNEWDDYARYLNSDAAQGVYGDNGSLMYHHGYGYAPYGPYSPATSPVPTMGHESQLYAHQQYQYPSPYFSPVAPTSGTFASAPATIPQPEVPSAAASQLPLSVESAGINTPAVANGGGKVVNGSVPVKPNHQDSSFSSKHGRSSLPSGFPVSGYQDPRFGSDGYQSPLPWLDAQAYYDVQSRPMTGNSYAWSNANTTPSSKNHTARSNTNVMGQTRQMSGMSNNHGFMNRIYPTKLYGQYGNCVNTGMAYGSTGGYALANGHGWYPFDSRYRSRGRGNGYGYGNENMDGLNELNRGPRAKISKSQKVFTPVTLAVKGQVIPSSGNHADEKSNLSEAPDRDQYNRSDFPDTYSEAKFFIIKSYSEDDIHKSIKYNVWSSTPNGNKKLDAAYREAQEKSGGCPVFLLFSVNTSGQFVGLAEMVGSVDFEKSVEYWQQDKWNGSFPLKWHIVKDVPNSLLKHITLENNENKPVTNSRDTQEVKLEQGLQVLKIFKEHSSNTSILDDFRFYESRQKMIQERKAKQQQYRKQVWEGKNFGEKNKEGQNGEQKPQIPEVASDSLNEAVSPVVANGDVKPSANGFVKTVSEHAAVN